MLIGKIIQNRRQSQTRQQSLDVRKVSSERTIDEEKSSSTSQPVIRESSKVDHIDSESLPDQPSSQSANKEVEENQKAIQSAAIVNIPPFYLNILLLNKNEVVGNRVTDKTGKGFLGRAAVYAANRLVTDEEIVSNIADNLINVVSKAIDEMGIAAEFSIKFTKGSLVVIKIQITEVDILQLVLSAKGPDYASNFTRLLMASEHLGMVGTVLPKIQNKIYSNINEGMINKFNDLIPQKMTEKGIHVDCHACKSEDQAEVFFDLHDKLVNLSTST